MGDVRFRQARGSDAGELLRIKRAAIDAIGDSHYDRHERAAWRPDDARETFAEAIESEQFDVLVAFREEPVGYGVLNAAAASIDALFVHPRYEGEGIASSLLGQLEMHARMGDISELTVVSSANAVGFYREQGYTRRETETQTIEGVDIEFVRLGKSLPD